MPNGPFPWFKPQTPQIQDHLLPINLPTFFMLFKFLSWHFSRDPSRVGRGQLLIQSGSRLPRDWFVATHFSSECQHFGTIAGDFKVDIYPWENDIVIVLWPGWAVGHRKILVAHALATPLKVSDGDFIGRRTQNYSFHTRSPNGWRHLVYCSWHFTRKYHP